MPRPSTIWATALVLASLSGSGPMLTTAEAMPAPGPQQTQMRPRYYFPRQVKRQIVTNSTAPAPSTSSSSFSSETSSSSSDVQTRQTSGDLTSFFESFFRLSSQSSSAAVSISSSEVISSAAAATSTMTVVVTPVPIPASSGTGDAVFDPSVSSTFSNPQQSSPVILSSDVQPSSDAEAISQSTKAPQPTESSDVVPPIVSSPAGVGSTGGLPETIIPPSSMAPSSAAEPSVPPSTTPATVGSAEDTRSFVQPTGGVPSSIVTPNLPVPIPSSVDSTAELSSTFAVPSAPVSSAPEFPLPTSGVASTGGIPSSIVLPSQPAASLDPPAESSVVVPTGGIPSSIVQPSQPATWTESPVDSSIVAPTGGVPSSIVQPSELATSNANGPLETSGAASTGGIPESIVVPSSPAPLTEQPSPSVASTILGPFIIPGSTDGVPTSIVLPSSTPDLSLSSDSDSTSGSTGELPTPTALLPSDPLTVLPTGSTGAIPIVLPTSDINLSSDVPLVSLPTSGIIVGITTAFGTSGAEPPSPTEPAVSVTGGPESIPTSESKTETAGLPLSDSSTIVLPSSVPGVSDTAPGPTAPTTADTSASPITVSPTSLSEILPVPTSGLSLSLPDISSIVSSIISQLPTVVPVPTGTAPLPTDLTSSISLEIPSTAPTVPLPTLPTTGIPDPIPSSSLSVPFSVPTSEVPASETSTQPVTNSPTIVSGTSWSAIVSIPTSSLSTGMSTDVPTPTVPPSTSGIVPPSGTSSGTGVTSAPTTISTALSTASETSIPASESPVTPSTHASTVLSSVPPSSTNATEGTSSQVTISTAPVTSPVVPPSSTIEPSSIVLSFTPPPPTKTSAVHSIQPTGTNTDTAYNVGSSIVVQPSTVATTSATGIPTDIATWISPPEGMPTGVPDDKFLGQIGFKYGLNYEFVRSNDGGNQIFTYLKMAIAYGLNITEDEVINYGLRAADTTQWNGFITTLAVFMIPKDLNTTLALQLRTPATDFWHNKNATVVQLTNVIDPSWPLPFGKMPGDASPSSGNDPAATSTDTPPGGAIGSDMAASHKVNPTSAGIATGAVLGAMAYGAAMFFVARRYRNKRLAHQRSSSVPSTSRYTYGSMTGPAWMSGGRGPGRLTPGGRDSRGSSSSNGRSIRTQQISAPVMAENSLGWN